jgi:hypothetical protein
MSSDDQLIHITSLLKARDYEQARAELNAFLKANPDQPEAWYLMSFAVGERARQIAALERAIKLDPSFAKASMRLNKLMSAGVAQPAARSSRRIGLLLIGVMVLGAILLVAVLLILPSFSAKPMPTALALPPSDTPKPPTLVAVIPASPTTAPSATNAGSATAAPGGMGIGNTTTQPLAIPVTDTSIPEDTLTAQPVTEAPSNTPETGIAATATPNQGAVAPTVEQPTAQQPTQPGATSGPTTAPTQGNPTATSGPTTPAATTVVPTITATVSGDPGVPLQQALTVGNGSMRIVSAAFPATNALKDIGVTPPAPPAGSQWALVEAFMQCNQGVNCAPDSASLKILGATGKTYPVTTAFSVTPIFGPDGYTPGQVWGYLEFAVENNEQPLRLVLTQGGQNYTFALQ